jgi:hypothetical protein
MVDVHPGAPGSGGGSFDDLFTDGYEAGVDVDVTVA